MSADAATGTLDTIEAALAAMRGGRPVLVVDADDRENEGDVILPAQHATAGWVGWTIRHTSGVLCVPMNDDRADLLQLPAMVARNQDPRQTAYTVSVDARLGIGTGISATDRSRTLRVLADPTAVPGDFVRPGHVFPLRARPGGVLERPGHTEAAVDLCRAARLVPVAVIAEVVGDDGEPLRLPSLRRLADTVGIPLVSIADLIAWRLRHDEAPVTAAPSRVQRVASAALPTGHGELIALAYRDRITGEDQLAVVTAMPGRPTSPMRRAARDVPLVRVHSECMTGDTLGSLRCDCGPQLDASLAAISADPAGGALVYLRGQEGRGIGLAAKIAAYALQDNGLDTVDANTAQGLPADAREYGAAAAILADLGMRRIRLLTNNPDKVSALSAAGIEVVRRIPVIAGVHPTSADYLRTKRDRMGHLLPQSIEFYGETSDNLVGWSA